MVRLLTDAPRVHRCWLRRRINTAVRRGERTVICSAVCVANRSLRSPLHDGGSRTSPTWYPHLRRWNRCYWVDSQLTSKCALGKKNSVDARSQGEPELLNDRPACSAVPEPGSVTRWIGAYRTGQTTDARLVWDRYLVRLRGLARRIFGQASLPRIVADEEDAVVGAFASFSRLARGRSRASPAARAFAAASPYHEMPHVETWPASGAANAVATGSWPRPICRGAKPDWPLSTSSQLESASPSPRSCTRGDSEASGPVAGRKTAADRHLAPRGLFRQGDCPASRVLAEPGPDQTRRDPPPVGGRGPVRRATQ